MDKDQSESNGTWRGNISTRLKHCTAYVDVRKDIQNLKVPNWKTLVQDRKRWKELVEKAKTLHKEL
jgi:hypothetical protein